MIGAIAWKPFYCKYASLQTVPVIKHSTERDIKCAAEMDLDKFSRTFSQVFSLF